MSMTWTVSSPRARVVVKTSTGDGAGRSSSRRIVCYKLLSYSILYYNTMYQKTMTTYYNL